MAAETTTPTAPQAQTPPPVRLKECSTCLYWDNSIQHPRNNHPTGLCRKNAPLPAQQFNAVVEDRSTGILVASAVWPVTLAGENCGEHKFPPIARGAAS